jgi:hypothetical protein
MEVMEGVQLVEGVREEEEKIVDDNERVFRVGELVEFWAGPVVRAYRTDSGAPAFVKEIHGSGWYGIKMVGSFGGRNRRVSWENLFKDGSFQKQVGKGCGVRVRTVARMQERAKDEAEAKLGVELRMTKLELHNLEMENIDTETQAEERLKQQEMKARKAEKELTAGHKRELKKMLENSSAEMLALVEEEEARHRTSRQCIRGLRKEVEALTEQVGREKEGQVDLEKLLGKANKKRTTLMGSVDCWKDRHAELQERTLEREERLRDIKKDMTEKAREMKTLEKRFEREDLLNKMEVDAFMKQKNELRQQLLDRNQDVTLIEEQNNEVGCCPVTLPIANILTLLTFVRKIRRQHAATNEQAKVTKEVVDRAALKRRKAFRQKRQGVARELEKARKDVNEAISAQQVRRGKRRGYTPQDKGRQDKKKQNKRRHFKRRHIRTRQDK